MREQVPIMSEDNSMAGTPYRLRSRRQGDVAGADSGCIDVE
jgi:hypothetical protein